MSTSLHTSQAPQHMTHYDTLGVSKEATEVEIKKCFRRLSLEFHPDRNVGTESRYTQIVEAYAVLGDPEKRRLYDISLKESLIERALVTRRSHTRDSINGRNAYKGRDGFDNRSYKYESDDSDYDYGDGYDGVRTRIRGGGMDRTICRDVEIERERERERRRGDRRLRMNRSVHSGDDDNDDSAQSGIRRHQTHSHTLEDIQHTLLITLEDSFMGVSLPITIRRSVNGKEEEAKIYVDVPAGTDNGEIIILEGKGHIDADLRMKSHVRVRVAIERHDVFRRDGLNIVCSMELSLKEALCGFRKEITHLDGKTYLVASEPGRIIGQGSRRVIPNKGFQRGHSSGNLVIIFSVVMPKSLTQKQIDVLSHTL